MRFWLVLVLSLAAAACQPLSSYPVDSPWYQPPAGSELVLNQPVEISPNAATVRFQFGKIVSGVQDFEPNCVFELTTVRETPQRVEPDVFVVTKVRSGSSIFRAERPQPPGLPGLMKAGLSFEGSSPTRYYYQTEMFLRSERQPNVLMMTCQHAWQSPPSRFEFQRPPTVAEMRQAMGDYFTLKLPGI
jgi:hypothetical protein